MILSDATIVEHIEDGKIVVEPDVEAEQIQPASLDVRIEDTLRDPWTDERLNSLVVEPKTFYHAYSVERFEFPNDIAGQLTGRSSLGRAGIIIHVTAGWFDPGFRGNAKFEIYNVSRRAYKLGEWQRVGQMVFVPTDRPTAGYNGQYQDQSR